VVGGRKTGEGRGEGEIRSAPWRKKGSMSFPTPEVLFFSPLLPQKVMDSSSFRCVYIFNFL
jgi:hypothetical protein